MYIYMTASVIPDQLRLLGDSTRWRILEFLADPILSCSTRADGICGCDLETFLGVTQPTVSHHMKQLVEAGLVTADRKGRWVFYELQPETFRKLAAALESIATAGDVATREQAAA